MAIGLAGCLTAFVPVSGAGAAADHAVTISAKCGGPAFCFTPATLTIHAGDTVTWTNRSGVDHVVGRCAPVECDGVSGGTGGAGVFASDLLADGATYSHTFGGTGTYTYYCAIHGYAGMHGVIVVNAAPPTSTATTIASSTTAQSVTTASPPGSLPTGGSVPVSVAATTATSAPDPGLASTGRNTGGTLALGIAVLVLGLAAWGVCTPRRGVLPRLPE
jgi:plastocyanin